MKNEIKLEVHITYYVFLNKLTQLPGGWKYLSDQVWSSEGGGSHW